MVSDRKRPEAPRGEKDPAGGLAAAPGAALAGRPARQRLGGRRRTAASSSSTPGSAARAGMRQFDLALAQAGFGLEDVRLLVCTHSHTDHYGLAAPIVEGAGCELWMHPAWEHVRLLADDPAAALEQRIEVARQSGVPLAVAGALPRGAQRRRRQRDRRDRRARPRPAAGGRGRDRPRHLAGLRDPRPRPLARRPAPARAQADDLRRPPARPHGALLRPRPHPRPARRVPRQPRPGRAARGRPLSCPATAGPSATRR